MDVLRKKTTEPCGKQLRQDYKMQGSRLYRKINGKLRYVVPSAVRWRVVKAAHDDRGHFGLEKTLECLMETFWFKRMRNYTKSYISACIECAYNKRPGGTTEGQLHITKTIPAPFRTVHIDHLGPFPKSSKGNAYVITVADSFSKYMVVKAVRTTDARPVTIMLNELSQYFGIPRRIVSDRGTTYTSKCIVEYCNKHSIHSRTCRQRPVNHGNSNPNTRAHTQLKRCWTVTGT